jgi:hypothetical protein
MTGRAGVRLRAIVAAAAFAGAAAAAARAAPQRASADAAAPAADRQRLTATIESALRAQGGGAAASVWLGGADGEPWFAREAGTARPTASAIKVFYLVELFAEHARQLDGPLPGAAAVLADDTHPAIGHFTPEQRAEIRRELGGASVRRAAQVMMGSAPASNAVYNAAANLITAALGGPEALTARIHRRDPAFATVAVRRYMLRDRTQHGDNEATAAALARVWQQIAAREIPGVDAATTDAVRAAVLQEPATIGRHLVKNGSLDSDPLAEVRAGCYETASGPIVYVVMTTLPAPGPDGRAFSSQSLAATATAIRDALIAATPAHAGR